MFSEKSILWWALFICHPLLSSERAKMWARVQPSHTPASSCLVTVTTDSEQSESWEFAPEKGMNAPPLDVKCCRYLHGLLNYFEHDPCWGSSIFFFSWDWPLPWWACCSQIAFVVDWFYKSTGSLRKGNIHSLAVSFKLQDRPFNSQVNRHWLESQLEACVQRPWPEWFLSGHQMTPLWAHSPVLRIISFTTPWRRGPVPSPDPRKRALFVFSKEKEYLPWRSKSKCSQRGSWMQRSPFSLHPQRHHFNGIFSNFKLWRSNLSQESLSHMYFAMIEQKFVKINILLNISSVYFLII